MSESNEKFLELVEKYLNNKITIEEKRELFKKIQSGLYGSSLEEHIIATWETERAAGSSLDEARKQAILKNIFAEENTASPVSEPVVRRMVRRQWMVAASVMFLVIAGAIAFFLNRGHNKTVIPASVQMAANDILPGGTKATLTLADGSMMILNDMPAGKLTRQGNSNVIKQDSGTLGYQQAQHGAQAAAFNILTTPRGGQYNIILPDGSKVWLNAASSLKFPTAFNGNDRTVTLSGEAYFEIAKDVTKPFKVSMKNGAAVEVLGTHFDVMAYDDEGTIQTTLQEGSVNVVNNNAVKRLKEGEQALITENGKIEVQKVEDADGSIAWKNGYITFTNADIKSIMRQAARWYDVEIEYEGAIPERIFTGSIGRTAKLSQLLHILEISKINFTIQGRTIIVRG